jgi:hypothetical protein
MPWAASQSRAYSVIRRETVTQEHGLQCPQGACMLQQSSQAWQCWHTVLSWVVAAAVAAATLSPGAWAPGAQRRPCALARGPSGAKQRHIIRTKLQLQVQLPPPPSWRSVPPGGHHPLATGSGRVQLPPPTLAGGGTPPLGSNHGPSLGFISPCRRHRPRRRRPSSRRWPARTW